MIFVCVLLTGGTLNEIHVPEHSPHWSAFSELKELQFIQKEAINAKVEAQQALEKAISQRRQQILQLEVQGLLNDGLQNQIEQLQAEKTKLMSNMSIFRKGRAEPVALIKCCNFMSLQTNKYINICTHNQCGGACVNVTT